MSVANLPQRFTLCAVATRNADCSTFYNREVANTFLISPFFVVVVVVSFALQISKLQIFVCVSEEEDVPECREATARPRKNTAAGEKM